MLEANNRAQAAESELAKVRAELLRTREAALAGTGREAELERLHHLKLEEEREKRVQHLGEIGVSMMNEARWAGAPGRRCTTSTSARRTRSKLRVRD